KISIPPAWGAGEPLEDAPNQAGVVERLDSAMPTGPCKGGKFRPGWQALFFSPPQSMLPLAAHASDCRPAVSGRFFPAVNSSPCFPTPIPTVCVSFLSLHGIPSTLAQRLGP